MRPALAGFVALGARCVGSGGVSLWPLRIVVVDVQVWRGGESLMSWSSLRLELEKCSELGCEENALVGGGVEDG